MGGESWHIKPIMDLSFKLQANQKSNNEITLLNISNINNADLTHPDTGCCRVGP